MVALANGLTDLAGSTKPHNYVGSVQMSGYHVGRWMEVEAQFRLVVRLHTRALRKLDPLSLSLLIFEVDIFILAFQIRCEDHLE